MAFTPLNALSAFVTVARHRSFSAAARELGVTTSALSQSVRQLETRLGVPLLARTSRSVSLTDAGLRLLDQGGPGVDQALESLRSALVPAGRVAGRVRLSAPSAAAQLLEGLLPMVAERHPGIVVEIYFDNRFVDIVEEGLDAGIRLTEAIDQDMVQVRLTGSDRFVVVGSPSYLERRGVPRKPEDLLHHACVGFRLSPKGGEYAWEFERGAQSWRVPVKGPVTTNDFSLRVSLAVRGVGLAFAAERLVAEQLRGGQLRALLEPYAVCIPGLFLYFPSRAQVSPALRAFVDVARELAAEGER